MKKFYFILFSLLVSFVEIHATTNPVSWSLVTSIDQIKSGGIYIVVAYDSKNQKSYFFNPKIVNSKFYRKSIVNTKVKSIPSTILTDSCNSYLAFKLMQETEGWTLSNNYSHQYIDQVYISNDFLFSENMSISSSSYWEISVNSDGTVDFCTKSDPNDHIAYNVSGDYFQPYTKNNTTYLTPYLYELTSYSLDEANGYSESSDLPASNVTLTRTFTDNVYNSLVLPCDVKGYQNVFGTGTQAYQLSDYTNDIINFKAVVGSDLSANVPYMITGTFGSSPYSLGNIPLNKVSTSSATTADGKCSFIGNYTKQDLSGKDVYILSNSKFYSCVSVASPYNISPFRCYFTISDNNAGAKFSIDGEVVSGIKEINASGNEGNIYDITGRIVPKSSLQKQGVYIQNGHLLIHH
jgi:hypothetical protein